MDIFSFFFSCAVVVTFLGQIKRSEGHGRLIEPPSRASAWRYGFKTPHNYNDHELYCGGFTRQWVKNEGKCGVCGDPWDSKTPRAHEYGGTYGQGVVVRKYGVGAIVTVRVELTASHFGFFEFAICPDYKTATQECLNKNILRLVKPQDNVDHQNVRYFPKEGNKVYEIKYRLPKKSCEHCLFQWRYVAGNNWGNCPNGTGAVGCGPQEEFRACADITISGKATDEEMTPEVTTPSIPTPEESYSPVSTLIISLVSFLVVFSILFLLYFHFYQIGGKIKKWIISRTRTNDQIKSVPQKTGTPLPPPRVKKQTPRPPPTKDGLMEVNLKANESIA